MQPSDLKPPSNPPPTGGGSAAANDKYVYIKARVMRGAEHICVAASTNMARRISNALTAYSESKALMTMEFLPVGTRVLRGAEHIALAPSPGLARLISAALNLYQPGDRGY